MPAPTIQVDFKTGKIVETPSDTLVPVSANGFDNITATLLASVAKAQDIINVPPSTSGVVIVGGITNIKCLVIITDGPVDVKINGASTAFSANPVLVLFGLVASGVTVGNPSGSTSRQVKFYAATDSN